MVVLNLPKANDGKLCNGWRHRDCYNYCQDAIFASLFLMFSIPITGHLLPITDHRLLITDYRLLPLLLPASVFRPLPCLLSLVPCRLSLVPCPLSLVPCPLSLVSCPLSLVPCPFFYSFSKIFKCFSGSASSISNASWALSAVRISEINVSGFSLPF
jgi:hypothetical protein